MPSKNRPFSVHEAERDLAADLLQSIQEMKEEKVRVVFSPAAQTGHAPRERRHAGLPTSRGHGLQSGVHLDDSAALLLELMESPQAPD